MKNWKVKVTAEGQILAEVKIQKDIFKGDSFSPQKYIIVIIPLN